MELIKPQRRTNIFDYWNSNKKMKIIEESKSNIISITHFEDLSNELFYEIFNYIDVYYIYKSFYHLNQRLQNLLTNSNLPLKINISSISKSTFQQYNRQILMPNKHRIISLHISNPFIVDMIFSPVRITSNFTRLKILIFNNIKSKYLSNILHHLISLSNLSSLIIIPIDHVSNPINLFQNIFRLPALKYCKILFETRFKNYLLPITTDIISPIEHLVIYNDLSLNQFNSLLSYVPNLRRLFIECLDQSSNFQTEVISNQLNNLKNIFLNKINLSFDQFELMSRNLFIQLEILRITINNNREYLNANRWEQLILFSIPKLRIFDFQYTNSFIDDIENNQAIYNSIINQFSSSFWIERQWFFDYQCYIIEYRNQVIFYSINPYKRKQYTLYKHLGKNIRPYHQRRNMKFVDHVYIKSEETMTSCSSYFSNATKLTLSDNFNESRIWLSMILKRIIPLKQLTTLVIDYFNFSIEQLIKLLMSTPNITTLTYNCNAIDEINSQTIQQSETFRLLSETNKIKNMNISERYSIENVKLFVALCSRMEYLTIDVYGHDLESSVRFILSNTKINIQKHLCLLCIKNSTKSLSGILKNLIESEEFLDNYIIKQIGYDLYLWW